MIIIKTTKGPHFINDREVRGIEYNKEKCEVVVTFASDMPERFIMRHMNMTSQYENRTVTINDVETVIYTNEAQSISWHY